MRRPVNPETRRDYLAGQARRGAPRPGEILTTGRVAALLGASPRKVAAWADQGRLRAYRLPGSKDRRVHAADLVEFMLMYSMFREVARCTVSEGGRLYRARLHDRWGRVVGRVAPRDSPDGAGSDWEPGVGSTYVLKGADEEAFRVLMNAGFQFEDGR